MKNNNFLVRFRDKVLIHSRVVFPFAGIALVAVVVAIALNIRKSAEQDEKAAELAEITKEETVEVIEVEEEIPMTPNTDQRISNIINEYYKAMLSGNGEGLTGICDTVSEQEKLRYEETSKYIADYPKLEMFVKPGPYDGSYIVFVYYTLRLNEFEDEIPAYKTHYVCTDENGELYIKRGENAPEEDDYLKKVMMQDDVIEFNNKVTVEYNELMKEKPEILEYLSVMDSEVNTAVGVALAKINSEDEIAEEIDPEQEIENAENLISEATESKTKYATAKTTVNVRASDSENADKLGKVSNGITLEITDIKENGWTEVIYEGKTGYIKSEFLDYIECASEQDATGSVKATTTVNVRTQPSTTADKQGVLATGDIVSTLSNENGWWKIIYKGKVGYVMEDYVEVVAR